MSQRARWLGCRLNRASRSHVHLMLPLALDMVPGATGSFDAPVQAIRLLAECSG
jgi:hypothetical protein